MLIGIPKQRSRFDNMVGRLSVWGDAAGNAFLEICEIANHEVRVFTKLPTFTAVTSLVPGKIPPVLKFSPAPGSLHGILHSYITAI